MIMFVKVIEREKQDLGGYQGDRDSDDDYLSRTFSGWYWKISPDFEFEDEFFIGKGEL